MLYSVFWGNEETYRDVIRKKSGSTTLDWNSFCGRDSWYCQSSEDHLIKKIKQSMDGTDFLEVNKHLASCFSKKILPTLLGASYETTGTSKT